MFRVLTRWYIDVFPSVYDFANGNFGSSKIERKLTMPGLFSYSLKQDGNRKVFLMMIVKINWLVTFSRALFYENFAPKVSFCMACNENPVFVQGTLKRSATR